MNRLANQQSMQLVGKFIVGTDLQGTTRAGTAEALYIDGSGKTFLKIGKYAVPVKSVKLIGEPSAFKSKTSTGSADHIPPGYPGGHGDKHMDPVRVLKGFSRKLAPEDTDRKRDRDGNAPKDVSPDLPTRKSTTPTGKSSHLMEEFIPKGRLSANRFLG